jgi:hypothetical protein
VWQRLSSSFSLTLSRVSRLQLQLQRVSSEMTIYVCSELIKMTERGRTHLQLQNTQQTTVTVTVTVTTQSHCLKSAQVTQVTSHNIILILRFY